uniref:SAM-dependent MTase RsmB/NOP-type domain-containing protein n=1 Tax=Chrysotila carterae TaxID=13221 RepID=A0A7S4C141_CHRCT
MPSLALTPLLLVVLLFGGAKSLLLPGGVKPMLLIAQASSFHKSVHRISQLPNRHTAVAAVAHDASTEFAGSRALAHAVLLKVHKNGAFANLALNALLAKSGTSFSGGSFATELVYGVLRNRASLDHFLGQLTNLNRTDVSTLTALRIGAYELLHLETADYAAVNEAVSLVPSGPRRRFANAVLRSLSRRRASLIDPPSLWLRYSLPEWLLRQLRASLLRTDAELGAWAASQQETPKIGLRVNTLRARPEDVKEAFSARGLVLEGTPIHGAFHLAGGGGNVAKLPGFKEGNWTVQDVAAQLVGVLASPSRGQTVLELCAAPGGKSTHLAELMGDDGRVISVEVHAKKAQLVRDACSRLGIQSVAVHAADATDVQTLKALLASSALTQAKMDTCSGGEQDPPASSDTSLADIVVLDAPCSGMGTLRRNPEHRYQDDSRLAELTKLQDRLLDAGAACVRPGGSLVYSVCSPLAVEGCERVAAVLHRHPEFECPEVTHRELVIYAASSTLLGGTNRCIQSWTHRHGGCDSFFAARLVRREGTAPVPGG